MTHKSKSVLAALGVPVLLTVVLAACGGGGSGGGGDNASGTTASGGGAAAHGSAGSLVIGSADFAENTLLADIYGDALQAKGVGVTKKLNIGERSVYWQAMKDGSIDFIPEYNGSILSYLDPHTTAKSTGEVTTALRHALGNHFTALTPSAAEDSDTISVTKATAEKYHLKTIEDLAPVAGHLSLGAPAAFQTRSDGIPALKSVYGVTFGTFTALSASGTVTQTALKNGTVDAADIFSTDPSFAKYGFVRLTDPKNMFAAQNVIPIISTAKVTPTIRTTVNAVSAKLSTPILAQLNKEVGTGDPGPVAMRWVKSEGLG